jgi:hypothetical protein
MCRIECLDSRSIFFNHSVYIDVYIKYYKPRDFAKSGLRKVNNSLLVVSISMKSTRGRSIHRLGSRSRGPIAHKFGRVRGNYCPKLQWITKQITRNASGREFPRCFQGKYTGGKFAVPYMGFKNTRISTI